VVSRRSEAEEAPVPNHSRHRPRGQSQNRSERRRARSLNAKAERIKSAAERHATLCIDLIPMPGGIDTVTDDAVFRGVVEWVEAVASGASEMACLLCSGVTWQTIDPKVSPPPRCFAVVRDIDWRERGHAQPIVVTSGICLSCCDRAGDLQRLRQPVADAYAAMWSDHPADIYENIHDATKAVQ
jgi:hypothetical protein